MVESGNSAVDPSNAAQAESWDGAGGAYWAANAEQFDRGVRSYQQRFLTAAGIGATSRVLDFGCGTGECSRDAARLAPAGFVLGVDLSTAMLEVARQSAAADGLTNVTFTRADAAVHPFPTESFDVAISRMGSMFFGEPAAAFANIGRALRPGGRLVLLVWQEAARNDWIREITTALAAGRDLPSPPANAPGPFALSDPDRVRGLLVGAGFVDPCFEALSGQVHFGADVERAYVFVLGVAGWMLDGLDDEGRARGLAALRASLGAHLSAAGVSYGSAAWLVTAHR